MHRRAVAWQDRGRRQPKGVMSSPIQIDVHRDADELCDTPASRAALRALRAAAGSNSPMERHCLRQFAIAERLKRGRTVDRELLLCACWLHDLGLFTKSADPYVTESARLVARVLEPFGWAPERLQRCMDACEQHHAPRSRLTMGLEVELVRQSDLVDVSAGLINFGVDRRWLRGLFRDVPRDGLWRLIGSAVIRELRERPATLVAVFVSPRRTRA
jgi:HD domain